MFEVPDAKRVRREDLCSSSDEEGIQENGSSQQDADLLRQKLSSLLAINLAVPPQNETEGDVAMDDADQEPTQPLPENEANQEEEFSFRLFSSAPAQKVVLAPEEEEIIASSEDIPFKERPISYYIQQPLTEEEQEKIRHSAMSGQDILALSKQRAWGLEVPWRVTRIEVVANNTKNPGKPSARGKIIEDGDKKKKRPGKKTRIKLRIKEQKRKEEESKKLTKEEHLKEKKKRLNREKKLKRRQKEKAKKAANGAAGGQEISEDDGGSGEE